MVAATARARVRESEREPESDATNARIDVVCALFVHVVSEHRQRHTCASSRMVYAGMQSVVSSLGPAISEIRGLFTVNILHVKGFTNRGSDSRGRFAY